MVVSQTMDDLVQVHILFYNFFLHGPGHLSSFILFLFVTVLDHKVKRNKKRKRTWERSMHFLYNLYSYRLAISSLFFISVGQSYKNKVKENVINDRVATAKQPFHGH